MKIQIRTTNWAEGKIQEKVVKYIQSYAVIAILSLALTLVLDNTAPLFVGNIATIILAGMTSLSYTKYKNETEEMKTKNRVSSEYANNNSRQGLHKKEEEDKAGKNI